jgi:hypothetical protein
VHAMVVGRIGPAAFKGGWARRMQAFDRLELPGSGVAANYQAAECECDSGRALAEAQLTGIRGWIRTRM